MHHQPINLAHKLRQFSDHWSPRVVAELNETQLKLVKLQGEFVWHKHPDTDEVFIVLNGEMEIAFRDGTVALRTGEMFVVPRGVEHRPSATLECQVLLIEPRGVSNTGDAGGARTAPSDVWI